jgi:hypothetical protein
MLQLGILPPGLYARSFHDWLWRELVNISTDYERIPLRILDSGSPQDGAVCLAMKKSVLVPR